MNLCIECGKVTMVGDICMDCIGKGKDTLGGIEELIEACPKCGSANIVDTFCSSCTWSSYYCPDCYLNVFCPCREGVDND